MLKKGTQDEVAKNIHKELMEVAQKMRTSPTKPKKKSQGGSAFTSVEKSSPFLSHQNTMDNGTPDEDPDLDSNRSMEAICDFFKHFEIDSMITHKCIATFCFKLRN